MPFAKPLVSARGSEIRKEPAPVADSKAAPKPLPLDRWAFPVAIAAIALLSACHLYYAIASRMPPSTDEAHYMGGAVSIAEGIRSGTLRGALAGYENALSFKAPLVCVPAALMMLAMGGLTLPAKLSLTLTFCALGFASYSLFRRCLKPFQSAMATILLLTMPMITGLTHRFYVELLLVLLCVVSVDVLIGEPWHSAKRSSLAGALFGLGLLCKSSFPALIALPAIYSLWLAARRPFRVWTIVVNMALAAVTAIAVAGPWYAKNWQATLHHARLSASAPELYYPHWIQADISASSSLVLFCLAVIGFGVIAIRFAQNSQDSAQRRAWVMIILFGLITVFLTAITINKATRYTATSLPMIAALAVAAWPEPASVRWSRYGLIALTAASMLLALHNSFGILPIPEMRIGELRIVSSHFPLNVPGWYEDNHPVDRRNFRLEEAEAIIAEDASTHLRAGKTAEARTTILSLLLNHDYYQAMTAANKSPVHYTWWPGSVTSGPDAPDYILGFEGFEQVYPGSHFFKHYPALQRDVSTGKIPYRVLSHLEGPSQTGIWIYVKDAALERAAAAR